MPNEATANPRRSRLTKRSPSQTKTLLVRSTAVLKPGLPASADHPAANVACLVNTARDTKRSDSQRARLRWRSGSACPTSRLHADRHSPLAVPRSSPRHRADQPIAPPSGMVRCGSRCPNFRRGHIQPISDATHPTSTAPASHQAWTIIDAKRKVENNPAEMERMNLPAF